jgi:uncharacterized membrane protein YfcA
MEIWQYLLIAVGAFLAGGVNSLAGGGTLITFPLLTFLGLPVVSANMTNTVALCPGYFGSTYAQKDLLQGQKSRLWWFVPAAILGGVTGGFLLILTGEKAFRNVVPFVILFAALLLAVGEPLKRWLISANGRDTVSLKQNFLGSGAVFLATCYGGYFGAGLGVILLAALGMVVNDSLVRLNALKQALSLSCNVAAALFFVFSHQVNWEVAGVMAVAALLGGVLGGKLAGKVNSQVLRWIVVAIGLGVAVYYFIALY